MLEVAENNENALAWYRKRNFRKLDAAIFLARLVPARSAFSGSRMEMLTQRVA